MSPTHHTDAGPPNAPKTEQALPDTDRPKDADGSPCQPTTAQRPDGARPSGSADNLTPNHLQHGRVIKTLWPPQAGTRKLSAQHGAALLCVRYREDPVGLRRYTTVELVIDGRPAPKARRKGMARWWFPIRVERKELTLHKLLRQHGAKWDPADRTWYLQPDALIDLGVQDRISNDPSPHPRSRTTERKK